MQAFLFRGPGRVFGVSTDEGGANLPAQFAPWTLFKPLTLNRGEAMPGLNVSECMDDIEQYGFHVTDAHVRITDSLI